MIETFDVVFQGSSQSECTDFIWAIRKYAKQNKKIDDNKWIADEVYDAFRGEALGWYVLLPPDVRKDWELLEQALATRWILGADDLARTTITSAAAPPMAAAAASPPGSSSSSIFAQSGEVGRVRIRANGNLEARYLSKDVLSEGDPGGKDHRLGGFVATTNAALAMKVRFIVAGPKAHRLELVEHESKLSVLAAFTYNTNDWIGTNCFSIFVGVDGPGQGSLKDRRTTYRGTDSRKDRQFYTDRWQLESTGRLKLHGPGDATESARFALGVQDKNKDFLWFNGPNTPLGPSVLEANLEFEPL